MVFQDRIPEEGWLRPACGEKIRNGTAAHFQRPDPITAATVRTVSALIPTRLFRAGKPLSALNRT